MRHAWCSQQAFTNSSRRTRCDGYIKTRFVSIPDCRDAQIDSSIQVPGCMHCAQRRCRRSAVYCTLPCSGQVRALCPSLNNLESVSPSKLCARPIISDEIDFLAAWSSVHSPMVEMEQVSGEPCDAMPSVCPVTDPTFMLLCEPCCEWPNYPFKVSIPRHPLRIGCSSL